MSIGTGSDYAQQLGKLNQKHYKDVQRTRESNEKNLENLQSAHKAIQERQKETYQKNLKKLDADYTRDFKEVTDHSKNIIKKKQQEFSDQIQSQKTNFNQERLKNTKATNDRFNLLKESYRKAFDAERGENKRIRDSLHDEHAKRLRFALDEQNRTYRDQDSGFNKRNKEFRQGMLDSEKRLVQQQHREMDAKEHRHIIEGEKLKNKEADRRERLRESHNVALSNMKKNTDRKIKANTEKRDEVIENLYQGYKARDQKLNQSHALDKSQMAREQELAIRNMAKNHRTRMEKMVIEHELENQAAADASAMNRKLLMDESRERQVERLKDFKAQMNAMEGNFTDRLKEGRERNQNANRKRAIRNANEAQKKDREFGQFISERLMKSRKERDNVVKAYQRREAQNTAIHNKQTADNAFKAKQKFDSQKQSLGNTIRNLQDENKKSIADVRDTSKKQKTSFLEKQKEERAKLSYELRKKNQEEQALLKQSFQTDLQAKELAQNRIKGKLEQQVKSNQLMAKDSLYKQEKLFQEQRQDDYRAMKNLMKSREADLKAQMNANKLKSEKKLQDITMKFENKVSQLKHEHEVELANLKNEVRSQIKINNRLTKEEVKKMKSNFEHKEKTLISQYENTIEKLRQSHKDYVEKITRRDRLQMGQVQQSGSENA